MSLRNVAMLLVACNGASLFEITDLITSSDTSV